MNQLDIIDQHLIIRETVGYEILNEVAIEDMPKVMEFLKIMYNYNRMKRFVSTPYEREKDAERWTKLMQK
jgi:hypothetical protein